MRKIIKKSKRGLTFSFNGDGTKFNVGDNYRYILDVKSKKIFIVPSETGLKVSRKKVSGKIKSLFDLRNNKILDNLGDTEYLEINILKDKIIVSSYVEADNKSNKNLNEQKIKSKKNNIINILKKKLLKTGNFVFKEKDLKLVCGLDYEQISFDSLISQSSSISETEHNSNYSTISNLKPIEAHLKSNNEKEDKCIETDFKKVTKIVSLFCGAGMLDYSFAEDKDFEIVYAVDKNDKSCLTYKNNISENVHCESVENIKGEEIPKADLLLAGPSCRPFSNANRNKGARLENHKDSKHLLETIRIINEGNYKAFVIENVPEILSAGNGEWLKEVKTKLSQFKIEIIKIKDCDYGGYTTRKRCFIIGFKTGVFTVPTKTHNETNYKTVGEALKKVNKTWFNYNDFTESKGITLERIKCVKQGGNAKDIPEELRTKGVQSNCYLRLHVDKLAPTIVNPRKPPLIHPFSNRSLSVAECIALSGFEQGYDFYGGLSSTQQQVGDGVPYFMGKTIKNIIKNLV